MKITKQRLKEIIKEEIQKEAKVRHYKAKGKWEVYDGDTDKVIKVVGNAAAATKLMNKLMDSGKYNEVGARVVKEGLNEASKYDEVKANMEKTMGLLVRKMGLKSTGRHLVGKGGMSFFLDDPKEAKKLQKYLQAKIKDVRLINLDKEGGDEANFVVYAKVFDF